MSEPAPPHVPAKISAVLVKSENALAFDLYRTLGRQPGNLVFSPYSMAQALGMAYMGARSDTAAEIARVLHWTDGGKGSTDFGRASAGQMNALESDRPQTFMLHIANAMWVGQSLQPISGFNTAIEYDFDGAIGRVDFGSDKNAAARINSWVERKTEGKISDFI